MDITTDFTTVISMMQRPSSKSGSSGVLKQASVRRRPVGPGGAPGGIERQDGLCRDVSRSESESDGTKTQLVERSVHEDS